jgi:hypothetical protein
MPVRLNSRISPLIDGSKLTHQTSPLLMGYVLEGDLGPVQGGLLLLMVFGHFSVSRIKIIRVHDLRTDYFPVFQDCPLGGERFNFYKVGFFQLADLPVVL